MEKSTECFQRLKCKINVRFEFIHNVNPTVDVDILFSDMFVRVLSYSGKNELFGINEIFCLEFTKS